MLSRNDSMPPIYGYLEPEYLLHYAAMNESNVVITGLPGTGKTTLVKTALRNLPEKFGAVVFDTARDFREVCDEYGVFSIDTTKVDPLIAVDLIEEALETVYRTYSLIWTPAMAELTIRALQAGVPLAKLAERVEEFADVNELSTSISVTRRARYFQYPHFDSNAAPHLEPKRGVVTCVDLNNMNPITRSAYVLFALHTLEDHKNIFYIIDEAHRFMRTSRALITEYMRVGRHNMQLFVLITQSINDIKEREGYAKIFVQFPAYGEEPVGPQWKTTYRALVTMYATNPRAEKALPPHHGVLRHYVLTVAPDALKSVQFLNKANERAWTVPS